MGLTASLKRFSLSYKHLLVLVSVIIGCGNSGNNQQKSTSIDASAKQPVDAAALDHAKAVDKATVAPDSSAPADSSVVPDQATPDATSVDAAPVVLPADCNPLTGTECFLPYPSSFFLKTNSATQTGYQVNYPDDVLPSTIPISQAQILVGKANYFDGFPLPARFLLNFPMASIPRPFLVKMRSISRLHRKALFNSLM